MLILTAQLLIAYIIEFFGLFGADKVGFEWTKLLGVAMMVSGIVVFSK